MKPLSSMLRYGFPGCFAGAMFFASPAARCAEGGPGNFAEFEKSAVAGAAVPAGLSEPLKSLWLAKAGQWAKAHEIAQDILTPTGSWIHAFLHREEGDLSNAAYWYRRAGMTMPKDVATANEWAEIAREIWQKENGIIAGREIFTSASGLVACSAETPAQQEGVWDTVIRKNGKVLLHIPNARPVSFNPAGDVLLLVDAAADDDSRHFLIKPAANLQVPPFGKRLSVGGRFVNQHQWSDDGKSLTLISDPAAGGVKPETVIVAEHLTAK
jgi:hypothetical protein